MNTQPIRRVVRYNFDRPFMESGAKTHVALVDKAANLTEALLIKSKTRTVTTEETEYNPDTDEYRENTERVALEDCGEGFVRVITDNRKYSSKLIKVI